MNVSLKKWWPNTKKYLISFSVTQLMLTTAALPILIAWGLGTSIMSLIGNLIYTPVLIVFILLSSLLLLTELCHIQNNFLVHALDYLTLYWERLLQYGSTSWMIECAKPPTILLIAILVIIFFALHDRRINTLSRRCTVLGFMLLTTYLLCWGYQWKGRLQHGIKKFDTKLYLIPLVDHSVIIVDEGFFSRKKSVEKILEFEFKPWITKQLGSIQVKELRIKNPTMGAFLAAKHMCSLWKVKEVWIPFFKKLPSPKAWWSFFSLRNYAKDHTIRLVRYPLLQKKVK